MQVELLCPHCLLRFQANDAESMAAALDQMRDEGPWFALGDGETSEDRIFHVLTNEGALRCPECGEGVPIGEESVARLAGELLLQW